ncbi:MAG: hypothetical protein HY665_05520 [Chloroflexi bacterium]|nr:hypothetical protein [Chloroflexota bacterium]
MSISHRYMEILNPSTSEKIIKLGKLLKLKKGNRVLTITEDKRQILREELSHFFIEEVEGDGQLKTAEARLVKLERMEKNLQRLYVEEEISLADFKENRAQIEAERSRLRTTVDGIRQRQHLIKADFEVALELATQFEFIYQNGNFDQRRLLCETVLKRLYVEDGKITREPDYNAPFAIIARANGSGAVTSGGPNVTFAKPTIETFFEVSIAPAPSLQREQAHDHLRESP